MGEPTRGPEIHWTHKLFVDNADLYLPFLEREKTALNRRSRFWLGYLPT